MGEFWVLNPELSAMQRAETYAKSNERFSNFLDSTSQVTFVLGQDLIGYVWEKNEPAFIR